MTYGLAFGVGFLVLWALLGMLAVGMAVATPG
jgi:hypothetical protein